MWALTYDEVSIEAERVSVVDPRAQVAERLLKRLAVAIKTFALYPPQHPVANRALVGMLAAARPYLDGYGACVVRVARHGLTVDGLSFESESLTALAHHLYTRKVATVTIHPAVSDQEVAAFLPVAGMDRISLESAGGIEHLLWQASVANIQVVEMTLQEQEVEALGLNAFLALIGRGRLAPREREAVVEVLHSAAQTAQFLQNIFLMCPEVFEAITPEEQLELTYQGVRSLDRVILDEPLDQQTHLYEGLTQAFLMVPDPPGRALAGTLVARATEDTTAKFLLTQMPVERLADVVASAVNPDAAAEQVPDLIGQLSLPGRKSEALLTLLAARFAFAGVPAGWLPQAASTAGLAALRAQRPEVPVEFVFDDTLITLDHAELARRLEEAKVIDEVGVSREVVLTLLDVLREESDDQELPEVFETLAGYLVWMVDHRQFPLLATALEHVTRLAAAGTGRRSELAAEIVRQATENTILDRLLGALWAGRETKVEDQVRTCLGILGGNAVLPLVRVLGWEPRAGMRAILCDLIVAVGRDHVDVLGNFVRDDRWYLVRNIANILGRLQHPGATPFLQQVIDHEEYRVRREVVDALARLGTDDAQHLLVRMLDDPDSRIQLKAIQALNASGARKALPRLLRVIQARDLFHRTFPLKTAALEALERVGDQAAIPVLQRLARSPLALGQRQKSLRALVRRVLLAMEGPPAMTPPRPAGG